MSRDPKTVTASELRFATTADVYDAQRKADVIVDVVEGKVVKNRCGVRPTVPPRKAHSDWVRYVQPMVLGVLRNWGRYHWSLQGFGMLRTYVTDELRLHVWNSSFAVPGVTAIHDHPWNFESRVVAGRIVNTRYRVTPCTHTAEQVEAERNKLGTPFVRTKITCGAGGGNVPAELKSAGERVWLEPFDPETYEAGDSYRQQANEVHYTMYDEGTVTLVSREFLPDTEHAHVFFRFDEEWISAEPRDAEPDEVSAIVQRALLRF